MIRKFLISTVGRKFIIGLTGIFLAVFILVHMAGNLLLFAGPKSYNMYSHLIISNPFIFLIEIILAGIFIIHIFWSLILAVSNKQKKSYSKDPHTETIHKTLFIQGVIIFIFVVLHLSTFKYGAYYTASYNNVEVRDLFRLVMEVFQKPLYVVWYLFCLIILSFHLGRGLQASLKSLGIYHDQWIQPLSTGYSIIVTLGFIAQPLYFFFFYQGGPLAP